MPWQKISDVDTWAVTAAMEKDCDGVMVGHIHVPKMAVVHGRKYINSGDFQESATVVVEYLDGRFAIMDLLKEPLRVPDSLTAEHL